jgi:hypothetical protein
MAPTIVPNPNPPKHPSDVERDADSLSRNLPPPGSAGSAPREDVTHGWPKEKK